MNIFPPSLAVGRRRGDEPTGGRPGIRAQHGRSARGSIAVLLTGAALLLPTACTSARPAPVGQPSNGSPTPAVTGSPATGGPTTGTPVTDSPAAVPSPAAPPAGGGTPVCHAADLSARGIGSDGHAGSGTSFYALTDTSGHACSLTGFATFRAVDVRGSTLRTTTQRTGTAKRVVLGPGGTAYVSITTTNVPTEGFEKAPCEPGAAALWLSPPGDSAHLVLTGPWRICGRGSLEITPFDPQRPAAAHF
ncbi:DUF4232 domain-containing protein [Micromonospora zhanjiangensis]|uniref:DUF4232 domain-containing protein n=1 Tax=Micromonospora zhanjiangensis TaxID=1522057 RepID=A0ABV8KEP1_9ACTN